MALTVNKVWFEAEKIFVELNDGRVVGTPVSWYLNLFKGTDLERKNFELWNGGQWIRWEELDEDLSAERFLSYSKNKITT